jgi:hypothetical protein
MSIVPLNYIPYDGIRTRKYAAAGVTQAELGIKMRSKA